MKRLIFTVAVVFLLSCVGSFALFVHDALRRPMLPALPPQYDGIVALTGGEDRVSVSLRLLLEHPSLHLLISGVGPHVTLAHITHQHNISLPVDLAQQISLGRRALTTVGNARETMAWAQKRNLHHLLVVTASYHMRRALLELHQAAPQLEVTAYPVQPAALAHPWNVTVMGLLLHEYAKLVGALLRDTFHPPGSKHGLVPAKG